MGREKAFHLGRDLLLDPYPEGEAAEPSGAFPFRRVAKVSFAGDALAGRFFRFGLGRHDGVHRWTSNREYRKAWKGLDYTPRSGFEWRVGFQIVADEIRAAIPRKIPTDLRRRQKRENMKLLPLLVAPFCFVGSFVANAAEPPAADAKCAALPLLQGTWEGLLVGDKLQKKVTVTITGNALRFYRDRNFWFETTVTLPAGKDPKQLHATITGRSPSQPVSVGRVVRAFFKIEEEALTLATIGDEADETPKTFEAAGTRYELRKVEPTGNEGPTRSEPGKVAPQKKYTQPPKPELDSFRFEVRPK